MTEYKAKSSDKLTFSLTQNDNLIGKLKYTSWFSFRATLELPSDSKLQIEPTGFWGTTIELKDQNNNVLLKFQMNWKSEIVIQTYFDNKGNDFVLKNIGLLKDSLVLVNQEGTGLVSIKPHIKWNEMNNEYVITTTDVFDNTTNQDILLLTAIHCANYYLADGML